jgi:osmoprotectant transport system substrate-binding protein
VVRRPTLLRHPEVGGALAELAGKISDQDMQRMNYAVEGQHREMKEVVREFLQQKGLQ